MCLTNVPKFLLLLEFFPQNKASLMTERIKPTVDGGMLETYQELRAPWGLLVNNSLRHQDRQYMSSFCQHEGQRHPSKLLIGQFD